MAPRLSRLAEFGRATPDSAGRQCSWTLEPVIENRHFPEPPGGSLLKVRALHLQRFRA